MSNFYIGWKIVFILFFITFYIHGAFILGFTAIFEPIVNELGWSYTQISIAASIRGLEVGLFAPLMGFFVDRYGPKKLLISGVTLIGMGFILLSQVHTLIMFYSIFFLITLGVSAFSGPVTTPAIAGWFKKDFGKALGVMSCGSGAGGLLLLAIVRFIDLFQWRTTLIILGLGMWIIGIPLTIAFRDHHEKENDFADKGVSNTPLSRNNTGSHEIHFKEIIKNRTFWQICSAEGIRLTTLTAVLTHIMPYLSSIGLSRSIAALVATVTPLMSIIGKLGFGWLSDRFDKRYVMGIAYLLACLGLTALSYAYIPWFIFPFLIFFPISWTSGVLRGAILREYFGTKKLGSILGFMAGIYAFARLFGAPIAGWRYDSTGSYYPIWLVFAAGFILSAALIFTLKPTKRQFT